MRDVYTIKNAYPEPINKDGEILIESENLIYTEVGNMLSGVQCNHVDNKHRQIHKLCRQVSKLMRVIDELNSKEQNNENK